MSSSEYRIYLASILQLTRTLVVKSVADAETMNTYNRNIGIFVEDGFPETWKYYMNLAGQYFQTDQMMTVKSLDTLEEIEFTVDNLFEHRATRRDYQYGTPYYKELIRRYPEQELLIHGILNPVDINVAIEAEDHSILYYDKALVEGTEINLIPKLEKWIKTYFTRWCNREYEMVDDLYSAGVIGIMSNFLPAVVLGIRLENCHTNFVHSFHIWQYLNSHGNLERYRKYLTTKQALFLYRNIKYIARNAGKEEIFHWLIERILTERNLPISKYDLHHSIEEMPDRLEPNIRMTKKPLNRLAANSQVDLTKTVREILYKENPLARDNPSTIDDAEAEITHKMENSQINRLPTKVLESSVIDASDIIPIPLGKILLNEWIFQSSTGRYTAMLSIVNPFTNEGMPMSVKDAFITYLYCINKLIGVDLPYIPNIDAKKIKKPVIPSFAELRKLAEPRYVSDCVINLALDEQPIVGPIISTELFYEKCVELQQAALRHREIYALREHFMSRAQTKGVTDHFYMDYCCELAPENTTFEKFFFDRGWFITELSRDSIESLSLQLLAAATGANLNTVVTLKEIQVELLRLMSQLGSYSTHYLNSVSTAEGMVLDWAAIRLGDIAGMGHDFHYIDKMCIDVMDAEGRTHGTRDLNGTADVYIETKDGKAYGDVEINPTIGVWLNGKVTGRYWLGGFNGKFVFPVKQNINELITVHDLNGLPINYVEKTSRNLSDVIKVTDLPGFGEFKPNSGDFNLGGISVIDLPGFGQPPLPVEDLLLAKVIDNDELNEF